MEFVEVASEFLCSCVVLFICYTLIHFGIVRRNIYVVLFSDIYRDLIYVKIFRALLRFRTERGEKGKN